MRAAGRVRQAISNFDKALAIQPDDTPTLEALIEMNASQKNWRSVRSVEKRFFDGDLDDDTRYDHLVASGVRWRDPAT